MDDSQKEVLMGHWRALKPNLVSAFAEETKELFPVDEETEKFLQVPTLDDFIGNCLVKRHGSKASFSKGKNLHSQPYKMLERIAYRGQQASFMGIVICMYMQQSLGNLLELLTDETPNIDKAIQQVRDIFAMSTKELDQAGRAGAFHHIIRRQMCMTDTSMFLLHDSRDISDLPLTGEGVFGDNLVSALKARKDKDKTLDDLLPDIFPKDRKRKTPLTDDSSKAKKSKIFQTQEIESSSKRQMMENSPNQTLVTRRLPFRLEEGSPIENDKCVLSDCHHSLNQRQQMQKN
ncbi:unnamed protein product [Mytilus edulis]|uniref:Uncharacterized protein n=1 Tax=Mytilus edulis TaxID=6550 RepID=A0A8S3RSB6_MYTED|nr:unnamed protein product [Mytilus edulis]